MLDVFRFDPNFEENELLWDQIKKEILGDDDDEDEDGEGEEGGEGEEEGKIPCYFCLTLNFSFHFCKLQSVTCFSTRSTQLQHLIFYSTSWASPARILYYTIPHCSTSSHFAHAYSILLISSYSIQFL